MHKAILAVVLAVASAGAMAEWTKVVNLPAGSLYVDDATIRSDGNMVRMVTLYDLNKPAINETNGKPYASQRVQNEFDCKGELWRMLEYSWYTGKMGEGKMVESFSESYELRPIPAGGAVEMLWKHACGKR